jgi:hypothetical protein
VEVDGDRILSDARSLSFPRYPGTEGDPRARALIARALEEAGLQVHQEGFSYDIRPAERALRSLILASALLTAAAGALAPLSVPVALVLLASSLLPGGLLLVPTRAAERLYRREGRTRTANVVGRRPVAGSRLMLVIVAHHDSKSQNLTLSWRIGLATLALVCSSALAALLLVALARAQGLGRLSGPALAAAGVSTLALLALSSLRSGNRSPGAVDNAGSVAVLLELARLLPGQVRDDVELVFLASGAEEDHMVGARRWLDAHCGQPGSPRILALNLDAVGAPGRVALAERYGLGRSFSPVLSRIARATASALGLEVRGLLLPPALGVDAIPFSQRGIDCLTLSSEPGRALMAVHSERDLPENLDRDSLERVARLALGILRRAAEDETL